MDRHPAMMVPALFLDRDGVVNEEKNYLHDPADVVLIPGSAEAIAEMNRLGVPVVIVTNQSGIGRGLYSEVDYHVVQDRLSNLLAEFHAHLDAAYHCPHNPQQQGLGPQPVACDCRKPSPGMLLRAASELGLDLRSSAMVGDTCADLEAARAAGCQVFLVRTGYGTETERDLIRQNRLGLADAVFDSLSAALPVLRGLSGRPTAPERSS